MSSVAEVRGEVDSVRIVGGELDGTDWRLGEGTIVLGSTGGLGRLSTFCFLRLESNLSAQPLVSLSSRNRMNT